MLLNHVLSEDLPLFSSNPLWINSYSPRIPVYLMVDDVLCNLKDMDKRGLLIELNRSNKISLWAANYFP